MALTIERLVERVLYVLGAEERSAGVAHYQIESRIMDATHKIADRIMRDPDPLRRSLLTLSFPPVAIGLGSGGVPGTLKRESLPRARVTFTDSLGAVFPRKMVYLATPTDLELPQPPEWIYYAVQASEFKVRGPDGLDYLDGTMTIHDGIYIPVIAVLEVSTDLRPELEDEIIDILVALVAPRQSPAEVPA